MLGLAEQAVADGDRIVEQQRAIAECLYANGLDHIGAADVLARMQKLQNARLAYLDSLRADY
jgi:hypothetical protein